MDSSPTMRQARGGERAPVQPLAVVVRATRGGASVGLVRLAGGALLVGAGPDSGLVLEDPAVSRRHLELTLAAEGVRARDLGSTNGTFYRGQRVGELTLGLGSRLTVGSTELSFEADVDDFEGTSGPTRAGYGPMIGAAPAMQHLFTLLGRLEGSLAGVLVQGESGTGKELVARAIHEHSRVAAGPFVALNCGALERSLVRSELFGHKRGAFTGAVADSPGAFEAANGGTLLLDEIGELPLEIQPVLLRVLETGEFTRVGEVRPRRSSVRLIAATNRNLADDVADGLFRADLYYRLKVVTLTVPPLRSRREDIPLLVEHVSARLGAGALPPEVVAAFASRSFPGNVRELAHLVEAYLAVGELPEPSAPPPGLDQALEAFLDPARPYAEQKDALVERLTYLYLRSLIARTGGNRSEAARVAGLQRGYLRRLLERHGLAAPSDTPDDGET